MILRLAVLALVMAAFAPQDALAAWKEVSVAVNLPPRLATETDQPLLVTRVRATDHDFLDVGLEISRWIRRELARQTPLDALDVRPPAIPEQQPQQLAANDVFWRRLGDDFGADIIVAGIADYVVEDRSGFITEDVRSPVTRQTVRQSRFAELRGFRLKLEIFVFKGDNGALLHHDIWKKESILGADRIPDDLSILYALLDTMRDDLLAVFLPVKLRQPRYIWVE